MKWSSVSGVRFLLDIFRADRIAEDWLNPAFTYGPRCLSPLSSNSAAQSDFRFTYLGPSGTFTPLHRDVYASYSWSANIVGRKIWWLFPPDPAVLAKLGIGLGDGSESQQGMVFDVRSLEGDHGAIKILQNVGNLWGVRTG
jgi:hypothetical protein